MITYTNEDCMAGMARYPDKHFDLAIVDPPYFKNGGNPEYYRSRVKCKKHKPIIETWEIPGKAYFDALFRVSKNQIIWGINYFEQYTAHVSRIVWDKESDGSPFSDAEIASWSMGVKVYMFRYKWNGMIQQDMKNKETRIHPTQKPTALYRWLLTNYAKPGDLILDTHVGSASSLIACHDMGFDAVGFELDADYYRMSKQRLDDFMRQPRIDAPVLDAWEQMGMEEAKC